MAQTTIIDPASFLAGMAKGAKFPPSLEQSARSAVKTFGPEFAEFMAARYGGHVAKVYREAVEAAAPAKQEAA